MEYDKDSKGKVGWDSHYRRVSENIDYDKFLKYSKNGAYIKRMIKFSYGAKTTLEFGSGKGGLSLILKKENPNLDIHLLDSEFEAIEYSKQLYEYHNLKAKFYNESFLKMSFENEYFDFIHGNTVLEHVESTNDAIKELVRVLKKGGKILITVPNSYRRFDGNDLYHTIFRLNYYNRTFYPNEIKKYFENNSCKVIDYFGRGLIYHYPSYLPRYFAEKIRNIKNKKNSTSEPTKTFNSIYSKKERIMYKSTFKKIDQLWDPVQNKINNFAEFSNLIPPSFNLVIGFVAEKI